MKETNIGLVYNSKMLETGQVVVSTRWRSNFCTGTLEYNIAIKMNERELHVSAWTNLKNGVE